MTSAKMKVGIYKDRTHNAVARVYRGTRSFPSIRRSGKTGSLSATLNACAPRARVQKEIGAEPKPARPETEGQALGLGPRFLRSGLINRCRFCFVKPASEFRIGQAFAADLTNHDREPLCIIHLAIIEPARLFVDVAKQMKGFHADVGTVESTLQETPEVLHAIGVNIPVRVLYGVIDDCVLIVTLQTFIRFQLVTEDGRSSFDLFVYVLLEFFLFAVVYHKGPNLSATFNHSHNHGFVFAARASDALLALRLVPYCEPCRQ